MAEAGEKASGEQEPGKAATEPPQHSTTVFTRANAHTPSAFDRRSCANTTEHLFSKHDNRHAFQNHGVYFGQGLGKRQVLDERNQHRSHDIISVSNDIPQQVSLHSTYHHSFTVCPPQKGASAVQKSQSRLPHAVGRAVGSSQRKTVSDNSTTLQKGVRLYRRYPRNHVPPRPCPSLTDSASWYVHHNSSDAYHTPLAVLACTQLPFLPQNTWRYSNRQKSHTTKRTMLNATL